MSNAVVLFGDSHAEAAFRDFTKTFPNIVLIDKHHNSKTMFSVGRDKSIIGFRNSTVEQIKSFQKAVLCFVFGEIDCRCHIHLQRRRFGRDEDEVIEQLVSAYLRTINALTSALQNCRVVIFGVSPPAPSEDQLPTFKYKGAESVRNFTPFFGTNSTRLRYTKKVNEQLAARCREFNFIYFNPYEEYTDPSTGLMREDCADESRIHIKDGAKLQQLFAARVLNV